MNLLFTPARRVHRFRIALELLIGAFTMLMFGKASMKDCKDNDETDAKPQG